MKQKEQYEKVCIKKSGICTLHGGILAIARKPIEAI